MAESPSTISKTSSFQEKTEAPPLAARAQLHETGRGPVTDAFCSFFDIKSRGHQDSEVLDDIATQPSVFDGPQADFYQPPHNWEVG